MQAPAQLNRTPETHTLSAPEFSGCLNEAMQIYAQAMGYPPLASSARAVSARRETAHDGLAPRSRWLAMGRSSALALAFRRSLASPGSKRCGGPSARSRSGVGLPMPLRWRNCTSSRTGKVLGSAVDSSRISSPTFPNRVAVLSTPDADTRAFRLYRRPGFVDIVRHHRLAGTHVPFAVLGAEFPLPPR